MDDELVYKTAYLMIVFTIIFLIVVLWEIIKGIFKKGIKIQTILIFIMIPTLIYFAIKCKIYALFIYIFLICLYCSRKYMNPNKKEVQFVERLNEIIKSNGTILEVNRLIWDIDKISPNILSKDLKRASIPELNKLKYILEKSKSHKNIRILFSAISPIILLALKEIIKKFLNQPYNKIIYYINSHQNEYLIILTLLLWILLLWGLVLANNLIAILFYKIPITIDYLLVQINSVIELKKEKEKEKNKEKISEINRNRFSEEKLCIEIIEKRDRRVRRQVKVEEN